MLLAGLIATGGDPGWRIGSASPLRLGALEYSAVFVALSLVTSRALVFGLAYVLIWEGVVAGLFAGTRTFSDPPARACICRRCSGRPRFGRALVGTAIVVGGLMIVQRSLAVRRLSRLEMRGETSQ